MVRSLQEVDVVLIFLWLGFLPPGMYPPPRRGNVSATNKIPPPPPVPDTLLTAFFASLMKQTYRIKYRYCCAFSARGAFPAPPPKTIFAEDYLPALAGCFSWWRSSKPETVTIPPHRGSPLHVLLYRETSVDGCTPCPRTTKKNKIFESRNVFFFLSP